MADKGLTATVGRLATSPRASRLEAVVQLGGPPPGSRARATTPRAATAIQRHSTDESSSSDVVADYTEERNSQFLSQLTPAPADQAGTTVNEASLATAQLDQRIWEWR